jgi:hypothetical protein
MPYQVLNKSHDTISLDDLYQEGDGLITNITMGISDASSLFSKTSCTIFDIYYFFSNCINITSCNHTFAYPENAYGYGKFN